MKKSLFFISLMVCLFVGSLSLAWAIEESILNDIKKINKKMDDFSFTEKGEVDPSIRTWLNTYKLNISKKQLVIDFCDDFTDRSPREEFIKRHAELGEYTIDTTNLDMDSFRVMPDNGGVQLLCKDGAKCIEKYFSSKDYGEDNRTTKVSRGESKVSGIILILKDEAVINELGVVLKKISSQLE